jgi:hypothetical protein
LSSPEVDGRDERRKVLVVINPRYGLRNLAIKPVGDLANALHIPGESLSAQRAGDGKQIFLWPAVVATNQRHHRLSRYHLQLRGSGAMAVSSRISPSASMRGPLTAKT